ncbi:MAG TPA: efflux RND transporter periplasmic adaptor subunit [Bacteroidia bacterium]
MKKKTIITISVIAVSLLLIGFLIKHFTNKTNQYYWRSVPVEKGDVNVLVTATGSMAADTSVDVGVQVSGIIAKIKVDFNDVVKKGQVIAILDTTLYYAAMLDAKAATQRAQVTLDEAKREFDRSKNLFDNKVAAQADYDVAMTSLQTAKGNLISAQAQLNRAVINLHYCTITAPISGMVIARNVQVGNMVIASFSSPVLFTIAYDLTKMQVQADVDEADIGQVKTGQKAKFTVDAYPNDVFTGVVTQVRHQPIMVQNVVNYVVIIEVPNPNLKLMPGLTANSNIFIQERKNVFKIPTNAFTFTPPIEYIQGAKLLPDSIKNFWLKKIRQTSELKKQQIVETNGTVGYIWVKSGEDIFPVKVTKGLNDGTFTEVSGDVKEGYEVAIGVNHSATAAGAQSSQTSKSPFMPSFPTKKK